MKLLVALLLPLGLTAQTATLNWGTTYQSIDGFGGAAMPDNSALSDTQMDFLYTPAGIGLSLFRFQLLPDVASCNSYYVSGSCVSTSGPTTGTSTISTAQRAIARGARAWAADWSPPAAMKSNGAFQAGGSMVGNSSNYAALAAIQAGFLGFLAGYEIPLYALSPQNEPDIVSGYPSCTWTAQQIHDYIPYLSAALASAGYSSTQIMIAESTDWYNNHTLMAMNDAAVAPLVGIVAAHYYGGSYGTLFSWGSQLTTQHIWETETGLNSGIAWDGTITGALTGAAEIHTWLTVAGVSAWHYWFLTNQGRMGGTNNDMALLDSSGTVSKLAYAMGNWAKFVRPGWVRIGVTYSGGLLISAFRDTAARNFAVVVVNSGSDSAQTFSVSGVSPNNVVPWVTSASLSLAAQAAVGVSGGSWTYTVPGSSVVTFVGQLGNVRSVAAGGGVAMGGAVN